MTGESLVYRLLSTVTELAWLAVLWLLAALPLVTLPAATVALFRVAGGRTGTVTGGTARRFFAAFAAGLGRSTRVGGGWLLAGAVLLGDFWAASRISGPVRVPLTGLLIALALAYAAATPFVFSALADRAGGWAAVRQALLATAGHPGAAVRCLVVEAACLTAVLVMWPLVLIVPAVGAAVLYRLCRVSQASEVEWAPTSSS